MKSGDETLSISTRRARILNVTLPIALAALFFVLVWSYYPFRGVSEFDPDEGNNLIKALMMSRGHKLYTEIWSDQPPLFTYMLRGWLTVAGWSADQARIFVLICSCVLLWALYQTVRPTWGHGGAIASVCLLATTQYYVALSVSAMLAIPTLMLAMVSAFCVTRFRQHPHPAWVSLSGVFLALSLFTKLFALPLAPLIALSVIYLAWSKRRQPELGGHWLRLVAFWAAGFGLTAGVLFLATIPLSEIAQLVRPHLDAQKQMVGKGWDEKYVEMLKADWVYAVLGLVGLINVFRRRDWVSLVPAVWLGLSAVALYRHRPLWYHHYVLLSFPMAWMAAAALGPLLSRELWRSWLPWNGLNSSLALAANALSLVLLVVTLNQSSTKLHREEEYAEQYVRMTPRDNYIAAVMKQFKDNTHYVITDRQMLPFSAGLIVPPELSVTSVKRFQSGHLTMEKLLNHFEKYKPEQVLLSFRRRIPPKPVLLDYLRSRYRLIYNAPPGDQLYVAPALADNALAALEQALTDVPQSEEGWYNWGVQLAAANRDAEAITALRRAVGIRPTAQAYEALAKIWKRLGKSEEAAEAQHSAQRLKAK